MGFLLNFQKLFELFVWHDYFLAPGAADTFTYPVPRTNPANPASPKNPRLDRAFDKLIPYSPGRFLRWSVAPETMLLLENRGLIFKENKYGCLVVSKTPFTETDTSVRLSLLGKLTDPQFLNYTNLGFTANSSRRQGKIFYLHNFNLQAGQNGRTNLSRSGVNYTMLTGNLFDWQPRLVRLEKSNPGSTATVLQVFSGIQSGNSPVLVEPLQSPAGATHFELDCRYLPSGLYRFESPEVKANPTILYIGLEQVGSAVLFVVDIFLSGLSGGKFDIHFNHH